MRESGNNRAVHWFMYSPPGSGKTNPDLNLAATLGAGYAAVPVRPAWIDQRIYWGSEVNVERALSINAF